MHQLESTFLEVTREFEEPDELGLAAELLSVTNEEELENFIGSLIKGASKLVRSPAGKALGGILKTVAKKALPIVGNMVAPGVGGLVGHAIASSLKTKKRDDHGVHSRADDEPDRGDRADRGDRHRDGPLQRLRERARRRALAKRRWGEERDPGEPSSAGASEIFGMELEGLSAEEAEFEVARHYVRFALEATRQLQALSQSGDGREAALSAARTAAEAYAPGLLEALSDEVEPDGPRFDHGRWMRRGNTIVLLGV